MLILNDGRSELWQWDTGRAINVPADCSQVHFSNKVFGRSIDVDVIDGVATIPDILLQTDKELTAWAFVGTAENGYTKISKVFKVNKRNKPADYVFTPVEQTTLAEIVERLENIESMQDPDAIKNAVENYLADNPIQVDEIDPTVPDWAKQPEKPKYTAVEVGALPDDTPIPSPYTLPVATAETLGGVKPVAATGDMTQPVGADAEGALFTAPGVGGGSGFVEIAARDYESGTAEGIITTNADGTPFSVLKYSEISVLLEVTFGESTGQLGVMFETSGGTKVLNVVHSNTVFKANATNKLAATIQILPHGITCLSMPISNEQVYPWLSTVQNNSMEILTAEQMQSIGRIRIYGLASATSTKVRISGRVA